MSPSALYQGVAMDSSHSRQGRPGRVIVGVDGSLGSLGAIRQAVRHARQRNAELCAVSIVPQEHPWIGLTPPAWIGSMPFGDGGRAGSREQIETAFQDALGGLPSDLQIRCVVITGAAIGPALVDFASRDDDLLVVGIGWHGRWRRWWLPSVSAYCVRHSRCPVLTVPPTGLARIVLRAGRRPRWRAGPEALLRA
jgi:nucleotide-binding universal stress UspA family protein